MREIIEENEKVSDVKAMELQALDYEKKIEREVDCVNSFKIVVVILHDVYAIEMVGINTISIIDLKKHIVNSLESGDL